MNIKLITKKGINLLEKPTGLNIFGPYNKFYPMTNENLTEMYSIFDIKGKDVLTVTSSGDHILGAIAKDAKSIDAFDINYFTEYYYFLKKAIIETYSLKEFKEEFLFKCISYGKTDITWYKKLRDNLDGNYQVFWDSIFNYANKNGTSLDRMFLSTAYYFKFLNYFNEEDYNLLKSKLAKANVHFINGDLMTIDRQLERKYDYMFLSNIADYEGIDNVYKYSRKKLMKNMKPGGKIAYAYLFDCTESKSKIFKADERFGVTSITPNQKDYVLTIKK